MHARPFILPLLTLILVGSSLRPARPSRVTADGRTGAAVTGPDMRVDLTGGQHPISPLIYGINFAGEALAAELHLPLRRWGGNSTTRYNWQLDTHNTGSDYFFENIPDGANEPGQSPGGSSVDQFVAQDRRTGTRSVLTIPLIGWTPKARPSGHPYDCGFPVAKYGVQKSVDPYDANCGNGVHPDGTPITGNDPTDTSKPIDPTFVAQWIQHLTATFGDAAHGGVGFYNLDNEPMLWNSTHRDIHPQGTTYDELRDRTYQYAPAVKAADPGAQTLGPVLWGWCAYFDSAADANQCRPASGGADRAAHGGQPFVAWYLQQMRAYEQAHGVRILDYLDLHNYPQAQGIALAGAGDAATQALRLRSTRSLWDPTYVDESWIGGLETGGTAVNLIPRMRAWVHDNYPGTRLAISEYNWGALDNINGALAQADVLGIFGREGLDLATLWAGPNANQPGAFAFRMYRNYDQHGSTFGDSSVPSQSADQDRLAIYGARRSTDGALTLMVINKTGADLTSTTALTGFTPAAAGKVYRYSAANAGAIVSASDQPVTATGFAATFSANSITLIVIPGSQSGPAPGSHCFDVPSISQCIGGRFDQYWQANGGLPVFGYPISAEHPEVNADTGQSYATQWFERNRFERHLDLAPPYDVLLGRIGAELLQKQGRDWHNEPNTPNPLGGTCRHFDQTNRDVCGPFLAYWEGHGLADPKLDSSGRSLALFGLPLTGVRSEQNPNGDTALTQWFERARFEYHPDKPQPFKVLLGLLGREQ